MATDDDDDDIYWYLKSTRPDLREGIQSIQALVYKGYVGEKMYVLE